MKIASTGRILFTLPLALALSCPTLATAQSYPNKPIKLIVPLSAGGTGDTLARTVGEAISKELGQPVVIENKPGAGGLGGHRARPRRPRMATPCSR
ncbi:MAG: hypothetical protein IPP91_20380 [Betaproteobacteria bacterium]|nr:hypothetical protein [Betaproteobacteria bacterium]